jgi:hypothetical protein
MPDPRTAWGESWIWLGGSLFLAVLSANIGWYFRRPRPGTIGEAVTRVVSWPYSPVLLQILRLLFYVGLPFAALLWGHDAVTRGLLGLQPFALPGFGGLAAGGALTTNWLDWARDIGWAVAVGAGGWTLLAIGWWAYRRALTSAGIGDEAARIGPSGWVLLREAAYHEAHWAFCRNAPVLTLGGYWGIWVGLALVGVEALLNPAWRQGMTEANQAPPQLMRVALAVISSVLFLQSENLWLALAVHFAVSLGMARLAGALPTPPLEAERIAHV